MPGVTTEYSFPEKFCKKLLGKNSWQRSLLGKLQSSNSVEFFRGFPQTFSWELRDIFQIRFFSKHFWVAALSVRVSINPLLANVLILFPLKTSKNVFHFYTPWKRQKTFDFLTFSGGIEMEHVLWCFQRV